MAKRLKILFKAHMSRYSGYGNDGVGAALALHRAGHDVYLQPGHVAPPWPEELCLLMKKTLEPPFDLTFDLRDPMQVEFSPQERRATAHAAYWTMWEWTSTDNMKKRTTLTRRWRNFDTIVCYDHISAQALEPHMLKRQKMTVCQGGYWPEDWPAATREWSGPFRFAMVGQLHQRKDPFVAIDAFRELKAEKGDDFADAELHLKTNIATLHPELQTLVPKLRIHYAVWPQEVMLEFYHGIHCLLAPSRGEGKNMPALEAMSTGIPVIATAWGGHEEWLSHEWGYPLDYKLCPESPRWPNCLNARADKDHLKQLMWDAYTDRETCRRKGELAARTIPNMCGWSAVASRLIERLEL